MRNQRPGSSPAWRSLWLWPVVIVLILLCWVGFWGWGSYGGWWGRSRNQGAVQSGTQQGNLPANQGPGASGSPAQNGETAEGNPQGHAGATVLNAGNKQPYVGETFELVAPVLKKISNTVFWIGNENGPSLLVVLANAAQRPANAQVQPGEQLNIVGSVEKAPARNDATKDWHLDRSAADRLEQQGAYVEATQATPMTRPRL